MASKPPKFAKSFNCTICRQVFHEKALLRQHLLVHFKCSKCEIQFGSRSLLHQHVEAVHWRLRNLCDRLDLPQPVLDAAAKLFKDFYWYHEGRTKAGICRDTIVSSCVFAATRQLQMNFPAKAYCVAVKLKTCVLFKCLRLMQSALDVSFAPPPKIEVE